MKGFKMSEEHFRQILSKNADVLAKLLTDGNTTFLLNYFTKNGVLSKAEHDFFISNDFGIPTATGLIKGLALKTDLPLDSIQDAFTGTGNLSAIAKLNSLLYRTKSRDAPWKEYDGSGDKPEDVSTCATNLVDEVIAKAEETTAEIADEIIKASPLLKKVQN